MESLFTFIGSYVAGWLSVGLASWVIGCFFCFTSAVSLMPAKGKPAQVAAVTYVFTFVIGLFLCWGDFHLLSWLASKRGGAVGLVAGAILPGLFMLRMVSAMPKATVVQIMKQ